MGDGRRGPSRAGAALVALRTALAHRDQRRLQVAWAACITAEGAQLVALSVHAFAAGGVVAVGILGVARTLPAAVLGPLAAAAADRLPRARVLAGVLALRAAALAGLALLVAADGPLAFVFAVASLDAVALSLYWPTHAAVQPELTTGPEELTAANAATTTIENLGLLAGPSLAAVLLAGGDARLVFSAAAVLAGGGVLALLRVAPPARREDGAVTDPGGVLAGFATIARKPAPRLVVTLYLAQTLCLGAVGVLVVVAALDLLGLGEAGVGTLTAAMGAGGMAGSVASLGLVGRPRLAVALGGALAAWGACLLAVGAVPVLGVALLALAGVGVCNALVDVSGLTLLQRVVDGPVLARVLGAFEGLWWAALGLGSVSASILVRVAGPRGALLAVGLVLPLLAVATARSLAALDRQAAAPGREAAVLARVPLLAPLATPALERLAAAAVPVDAATGAVVVHAGEIGDRYYAIAAGAVVVATSGGPVVLGPGEGFGEIALLHDVPRTATVTAAEPTRLLAITREDFLGAVTGHAAAARAAAAVVSERLGGAPAGRRR